MDRRFVDAVLLRKTPPEGEYFAALPAVRHLTREGGLPLSSDVTFFIGENGSGKSTLLEAIAVACGLNAEGGSRNFNFSTNNTHSGLHDYITISRSRYPEDTFFLRAESFYNVATNIEQLEMQSSYGGLSLHNQSHGESFLALVHNRFWGNGLYLLDEPEAALSPSRLFALICEIDALVKERSQFIIATHSPILMAFPGACVYEFTERGISEVDYRETDHFRLTKRFLDAPERMLEMLLGEEV